MMIELKDGSFVRASAIVAIRVQDGTHVPLAKPRVMLEYAIGKTSGATHVECATLDEACEYAAGLADDVDSAEALVAD